MNIFVNEMFAENINCELSFFTFGGRNEKDEGAGSVNN